ncbi:MAG TPA: FdhF/YdeP family oxidoreductase [Candidatus Thermoplasmatota archaeon]|nr:FdhF/YdeP family oxidoreductase [Candidatus Thermoplasmatota archaeon]
MPLPRKPFATRLKEAVPFGLLVESKPRHYREMLKVAWENRDNAAYALRILRHGVCDGCSLGPNGLKDDVIPGTHLCLTRLKLLRLNTMGPMREEDWSDIERLRAMSNRELQALGRIPFPLLLEPGAKGFRRIDWAEALAIVTRRLERTAPDRLGFFVTSRGLTNEPYYVVQKLARALGTNNVDLCSRLCHAPSVSGLRETIGWGAPTCSLSDFIGTDLLILFGTDLPNNQPVSTKYMHVARKRGTRIVVVNPVLEPGLERYWIPSVPSSALFGTPLCDAFFEVNVGGDVAFIHGVLKALFEAGLEDKAFIAEQTTGFDALREHVAKLSWGELESRSGAKREKMEAFARMYGEASSAVIVYSMGLTQHSFGVDNVRSVVNLALAKGNVGRPKTGIMPIRGHSGVQGGGECGVDPEKLPGGVPLTAESAKRFSDLWGFDVPVEKGLMTGEMLERAARGEMDVLYSLGGNLLETMPDPRFMREALASVPLRIHQDIVLNTSTVLDAAEAVLVLPAQTRYEQRSGGTSTSTERRIRFTPEIEGHPVIGEARPEWEIPALIGRAMGKPGFAYRDSAEIRAEMATSMPMYAGVETLEKQGDWVQWGGERLGADGFVNMPDRRARFSVVALPPRLVPEGRFLLTTRRGKQFNSIVFGDKDYLLRNGDREDVFLHADDLAHLGLADGDDVILSNETGTLRATARAGPIARRHVQAYWPEANVLIPRKYDPIAGVPDYNAFVSIRRAER